VSGVWLEERNVSIGAIELHLVTGGHQPGAPTLVLLHGLYDRWEVWQPLIDQLGSDFRIIAPDLRGHARSEHPETGYALTDYASDIAGLLDALGIFRTTIAGHSLGALVALSFAAEFPERAENLVMIDPPVRQGEHGRQLLEILLEARRADPAETYEIISELYAFSGTEADWRRQSDWLRSTSEAAFVAMIAMTEASSTEHLLELMERVRCPSLLIQADPMSGGVLSDDDAALAMRHLVSGTLFKSNSAGHSLHQDSPEELAGQIKAFTGAG
jgi:N-formylmaleamate deformylase